MSALYLTTVHKPGMRRERAGPASHENAMSVSNQTNRGLHVTEKVRFTPFDKLKTSSYIRLFRLHAANVAPLTVHGRLDLMDESIDGRWALFNPLVLRRKTTTTCRQTNPGILYQD